MIAAVPATLLAAVALPAAAGAGTAVAPAVNPHSVGYLGHAFGTEIDVASGTLGSGPTANIVAGCIESPGTVHHDTTAGINVPGVLSTGAVATSLVSNATGTTKSEVGTARVATVSLLGGMVGAKAITATSTTSLTGGAFSATGSSVFLGLTVNGTAEPGSVPPNTTIALPGVGTIVLNEERSNVGATSATQQTTAIDIHVLTANSYGLPIGSHVIVSRALTGLVTAPSPLVNGDAFGTKLTALSGTLFSGPTANQPLQCQGTGGATLTNSTAGVNVPGVLTSGTVTSTAEGNLVTGDSTANTSDTVENLNVLPGLPGLPVPFTSLITATAVRAQAHAENANGTKSFTSAGSSFVGLKVAGFPLINDNVPPNTTVNIPGVGTLYLNRVVQNGHSIEVRMIQLDITATGLPEPVGTELIVADASAGVQ